MKRSLLFSGLLAVGLLATSSAFAGTATSSFTASVTVDSACEVTATPVDFGSVGMFEGPADNIAGAYALSTQSQLTLNCTDTLPLVIAMSEYGNPNADQGVLNMYGAVNTSSKLTYRLFQDSAYAMPWGSNGDTTMALTAVVGTQTLPIYSEVLASDNHSDGSPNSVVMADSYSGSATITVNW